MARAGFSGAGEKLGVKNPNAADADDGDADAAKEK